jgi:hypothetical protein
MPFVILTISFYRTDYGYLAIKRNCLLRNTKVHGYYHKITPFDPRLSLLYVFPLLTFTVSGPHFLRRLVLECLLLVCFFLLVWEISFCSHKPTSWNICILAYYPYFEKRKQAYVITMVSVCLCIPPLNCWMPDPVFMKLVHVYHDTWAHLNGLLYKSLP